MQRLKDVMVPLMQRMDLYEPARDRMALHAWPQVVGPLVARNTAAVAIRGGILFVRTASSAWMNELTLGFRDQYVAALNARLGNAVVRDIRFLPPPLPTERDEEAIIEAVPFDGRGIQLGADLETFVQETVAVVESEAARRDLAAVMRNALRAQEVRRRKGWRPCPHCGGLTEDGAACDVCRRTRARERSAHIHDLMLQAPWMTAPDLKMRLPDLEPAEFQREKGILLRSLRGKLHRWLDAARPDEAMRGNALVYALRYCMLRTGKLPHQLTGTDIRFSLGAKLAARFPER